jgi:Nif-specific regulatory protein
VQVKRLRVLQEREYERVGGTATLKADIRLIAATNRDLNAGMAAARFRSDLFYRLSVFDVHSPRSGSRTTMCSSSWTRSSDLSPRTWARATSRSSRDACEMLRRHPWPGNIGELQNAIERGLITCDGTLVTAAHLGIPPSSEHAAPAAVPRRHRPRLLPGGRLRTSSAMRSSTGWRVRMGTSCVRLRSSGRHAFSSIRARSHRIETPRD